MMRLLLNRVAGSVSHDKELVKELASMAKHLKALDGSPNEDLPRDKAKVILGKTLNFFRILLLYLMKNTK